MQHFKNTVQAYTRCEMKVLTSFILTLFFLIPVSGIGQRLFSDNLYVRAAYRAGVVLPEYPLFTYLAEDYVHAFQVSLSKRTTDDNVWAHVYNRPEYGINLQYSTLGNPAVYGNAISVYPFVGIAYINGTRFTLWNQIGFGIGFATKKYEAESNPHNVAIGSHGNIHFNFELNAEYRLLSRVAAYTGVCFDHLSNGNLSEPNLGINTMTFNAGLRYLVGAATEKINPVFESHTPGTRATVLLAMGSKHARSLQSKSYFVSALSFEYKYKLSRIFFPGIGVDVFYDGATQEEVRAFGTEPYAPGDDFKTGIHLSQELVFNKFSIAIQEGFYVFLKDKAFANATYHRFIIRHQVGDRWFAQLSMKSHLVVLDYLEFGIGYLIKP